MNIAAARRQLGLTQKQLADILRTTPGHISKIERGIHASPFIELLMEAYLSNYRPANWPKKPGGKW